MVQAYLFRLIGLAGVIVLIMNVNKHGWHPVSVAIGAVFSAVMFSLGVAPERRTKAWEIRYVIAGIGVASLAALRFLR